MPAETSSSSDRAPLLAALAFVALALGGLLVGYEPVSSDPDNLYRPIKSELARSLRQGSLPFWSDRFGLGAPLVAESHVAAFYPPNWLLFGTLDVATAYRLEMWLHYLALVLAMYGYARALKISAWGAALSALSLALSGFQASHSCHEPFYVELPYLPLALMLAERYLAVGGVARLAALALALGAQITVGHFQIQMWTCGLVLFTAVWRASGRSTSWRRAAALGLTVAWGVAIASVQLGLTHELTRMTSFSRPARFLMNYSYPPMNWAQPILPKLFMGFHESRWAEYWAKQETSADEACFYVGTVPLILAAAGWLAPRDRALNPWRLLAPLGLVLATMPRLWPFGYELLLYLPGLGMFRGPGRYTLLTTVGLCLLAGRGFDRALSARRFWSGVSIAVVLAIVGFAWGVSWTTRPEVASQLGGRGGTVYLLAAALAWTASLAALAAWRLRPGRGWVWAPVTVAAVELTLLYYQGTTEWGWSIRFPQDSPVFQTLARETTVGRIVGELQSVPVRAGYNPAYPYLSIFPPPPNYLLETSKFAHTYNKTLLPWLRRSWVTHGVYHGPLPFREDAEVLYLGPDPALDALLPMMTEGKPRSRLWRLERYPDAEPPARVAREARTVADWYEMFPTLSERVTPDIVWYYRADAPADPPGPRARTARVVRWDGRSGTVEHDGTVDLVLSRTYYPGWTVRLDDGPAVPVVPAEGGYQAIRIPGSGTTRVAVSYRPTPLARFGSVSLVATAAALVTLGGLGLRRLRR